MCGIAGIRRFDGEPIDPNQLEAMSDKLIHRGPSDHGHWIDGPVGFAHRRLSIISPSDSQQPMSKDHGHICFNGEIFNYQQKRHKLQRLGCNFITNGDTEVLLETLKLQALEGIDDLDGQFALAYFDSHTKELILLRDRMGILPLYYYWDGVVLFFASEIKALLAVLPNISVDEQSVMDYLGFRSVPAPDTLFKDIKQLMPGSVIRLDAQGSLTSHVYWQLPKSVPRETIDISQSIEEVSKAIEHSVKNRLVADTTVGALLSGGLDSSLIVAIAAKLQGRKQLPTFTAGFSTPGYDERAFAEIVSKQYNTKAHIVEVDHSTFLNNHINLTWHREAPLSEPADIVIGCLAKAATENSVNVLLSGEGADELFAGYPKYQYAKWAALADKIPNAIRKKLFTFVEQNLGAKSRVKAPRVMLRAMSEASEQDRFQTWFAPFTKSERSSLSRAMSRNGYSNIYNRARGDLINRMLYVDCHTWLSDNLLARGDRMTMSASVESRPPFLEHNLIELAFSLPSNVKIRNGSPKWILKEAAKKHLPKSIIHRKKFGFHIPIDQWFREGLRDYTHDLLLSSNSFVGNHLNRSDISLLLASHTSEKSNDAIRIWTLLSLEIWYARFFRDNSSPNQFKFESVKTQKCNPTHK